MRAVHANATIRKSFVLEGMSGMDMSVSAMKSITAPEYVDGVVANVCIDSQFVMCGIILPLFPASIFILKYLTIVSLAGLQFAVLFKQYTFIPN